MSYAQLHSLSTIQPRSQRGCYDRKTIIRGHLVAHQSEEHKNQGLVVGACMRGKHIKTYYTANSGEIHKLKL